MTHRSWIRALSALGVVGLMGCGGGGDGGTEAPPSPPGSAANSLSEPLPWIEANIFEKGCATIGCHRGSSAAGALTLERGKSHGALVGKPSTLVASKKLVVAGQPEQSFLLAKLRGHLGEGEGAPMPYGKPPLSESEIATIETWIKAGAPAD